MAEEQSNIRQENNTARVGMNLDLSVNQIPKGVLSYALNAALENYDANGVSYQNEPGNNLCLNFPEGYLYNGHHFIVEQNKHIFFLVNPDTGGSEIGYMDNNNCIYHTYINSDCLNFSISDPILKVVHKITNCTTEIYWASKTNPRRYLDLNNLPYKIQEGTDVCKNVTTPEIDCNKLKIQPNFSIPSLEVVDVISGGNNLAGTYQFAFQYSDVAGDAYTSFYSVTNPTPIADTHLITADFNYPVGKSIVLNINNIDTTGYFKYFNVAVIKTINAITSVELIGTYFIDNSTHQITYSGQNQTQIKLTIADIFEKYPYYDIAEDVTFVQDVLVWDKLTSIDRINYQQIASKITLQWETWRIPNTENYSNELNATNLRGYLRDEVYPFEIVFLLDNGKQTDGFHIPGRAISYLEESHPDALSSDPDFIENGTSAPYWKIYNTASVTGTNPAYSSSSDYKGPYQYGEFAYWESTETYPCNTDVWGDLAGQPIRHHKFPDVRVSPIFENPSIELNSDGTYKNLAIQKDAIFPIGVKLDVSQVFQLIVQSNLTQSQKDSIIGFKIVRGDRNTNKSIIAKGILRNVGKYEREGTSYYFPNYPYNDLKKDPFLLEKPNAYNAESNVYKLDITVPGTYQYTDVYTNKLTTGTSDYGLNYVCSLTLPVIITGTATTITKIDYDLYDLVSIGGDTVFTYQDAITETYISITVTPSTPATVQVKKVLPTPVPPIVSSTTGTYLITLVSYLTNPYCYPNNLEAFNTDNSKYRHVFSSPETSFGQPYLGNILKLENAIFGAGKAHFVEVKNNALYKLLTKEAQEDALESSAKIANLTAPFSPTAMFTAYQSYIQIYLNGISRRNYGYSYNSILSYDYYSDIDNGLGIKQRKLDISQYLIPGVQSVSDDLNINNYNRESSVYLKTTSSAIPLPFPKDTQSLLVGGVIPAIEDNSRYINSEKNCALPNDQFDISSVCYYAAIKNTFDNQWGQMYSYETIDTGAQFKLGAGDTSVTIFGGDTFISQFSFKTKLPFFIDNRVGANDDSDIFYDEIGNVAYPEFWHSSRSILYDYSSSIVTTPMKNIISVKAHNLDCPNNQFPKPDETTTPPVINPDRAIYGGKMYMFAYGIPTFYVETSVNVDLRQAFNTKEGDFYPHVSTGIPDNWVQETNVPIIQDNTYYYNVTFSKQNKENYFSHLPINWTEQLCYTNFPFRTIFSDPQQSYVDNRINSWLIYKPSSFYDFPQNYGKLTSLDGIENRQVLARFENKSLLYNALYTNSVNTGGQVYLGQPLFSSATPPLDFAETDLGYIGSQNKFLLKIPQGQITVDAKRGQVFLISNNRATDISAFGSGLNRFFTDHLAFEILRYFPTVDTDNHFTGVGLHGVYDSKYDRVIITKLDYIPISNNVYYDEVEKKFYTNILIGETSIKTFIELTDSTYFCNKSWTVSFNLNTSSWVSFHSYIPNWYIGENNFFYSGINESCNIDLIAGPIVYCDLVGTAIMQHSPECDLAGIAFYYTTTTTTSTSTSTTSTTTTAAPTTTTTTTTPPDCGLNGTAVQL